VLIVLLLVVAAVVAQTMQVAVAQVVFAQVQISL
jgi:hypothetical protein